MLQDRPFYRSMIINSRKVVSIILVLSWLFSISKFVWTCSIKNYLKWPGSLKFLRRASKSMIWKVYFVGFTITNFHLSDLSERKSQNPLLAATPQINSSFPNRLNHKTVKPHTFCLFYLSNLYILIFYYTLYHTKDYTRYWTRYLRVR